jgi:hypothetical protein
VAVDNDKFLVLFPILTNTNESTNQQTNTFQCVIPSMIISQISLLCLFSSLLFIMFEFLISNNMKFTYTIFFVPLLMKHFRSVFCHCEEIENHGTNSRKKRITSHQILHNFNVVASDFVVILTVRKAQTKRKSLLMRIEFFF